MNTENTMKATEVKITYHPKIKASERAKISSSKQCYDILKPFYSEIIEHREYSFIALLNSANKVLGVTKISEGGCTGTVMDVRTIFQAAILANAVGVIISHNHPSGNLKPSEADKRITRNLVEAGKIMEIALLDHIILTDESYFSFADNGLI